MDDKKQLFGWFSSEKKYTVEEVRVLLDKINEFDCGAIDDYLTKHVEKVFAQWLEDHKGE